MPNISRPPLVLASRYALSTLLGRGGMGEVWLAQDTILHREVAVKVIRLGNDLDTHTRDRFTREATIAAALSHPHIVTVHDFVVDEDEAFLVMEKLAGPDLGKLLRERGPLPVHVALAYVTQVAEGLAAAHLRGVLHRDIKPENLMLDDHGAVKIVDFGIAALAEQAGQMTGSGQVLGTAAYLAPECLSGQPASAQSDLYSLGCVLMTLLTGRPPFEGSPAEVLFKNLHEPAPRLSSRRQDLPIPLDRFEQALLAKDPSARPPSARDVVAWLHNLQSLEATRALDGRGVPQWPAQPLRATADFAGTPADTPTSVMPRSSSAEGPAGVYAATQTYTNWLPPTGPRRSRRRRWVKGVGIGLVSLAAISALMVPGIIGRTAGSAPTGSPSSVPVSPSVQPIRREVASTYSVGRFPSSVVVVEGRAYVGNGGDHTVSVLDAASGQTLSVIKVGKSPYPLAADPVTGRVYVGNTEDGTVSVINTTHGTVVRTIPVGRSPIYLLVDGSNGRLFVANETDGTVSVVNTANDLVEATVKVGKSPWGMALDEAGRLLYVANHDDATLSVVATTGNRIVATQPVDPYPKGLAYDPGTGDLYVTHLESSRLSVIDPGTWNTKTALPLSKGPLGATIDSRAGLLYVVNTESGSVSVINTTDHSILSTIPVGQRPKRAALDAETSKVYVANWGDNTISVISIPPK